MSSEGRDDAAHNPSWVLDVHKLAISPISVGIVPVKVFSYNEI